MQLRRSGPVEVVLLVVARGHHDIAPSVVANITVHLNDLEEARPCADLAVLLFEFIKNRGVSGGGLAQDNIFVS